jgi:hypothetical protein
MHVLLLPRQQVRQGLADVGEIARDQAQRVGAALGG